MLSDALERLCRSYRVQPTYHDAFGQLRDSSDESLVRVLQCLGAQLETVEEAGLAYAARSEELFARVWEPVHVHWLRSLDAEPAGEGPSNSEPIVLLKFSPPSGATQFQLDVLCEGGERLVCRGEVADCAETSMPEALRRLVGDQESPRPWRLLALPCVPEMGVHGLTLTVGSLTARAVLIVAPQRAWAAPDAADWGVFAPTYALRDSRNSAPAVAGEARLGFGDIGHLSDLVTWVGKQGGQAVATLPMLAQFLDEIFEPSPYSPASRLFWNEFYLDLSALPELSDCPEAQRLLAEPQFVQGVANAQDQSCVDYQAQVPIKRLLLEHLTRTFFALKRDESTEFRQFLQRERVELYARFRAQGEALRRPFQSWPAWANGASTGRHCFNEDNYRYHLYCQFRLSEQMEGLGREARKLGLGLYLDLPVGVHGSGFDLWAEPDAFLLDCAAGAPPDVVFTGGQDWGTAPLSPEGLRRQGYRYLRDVLRHHLRSAGALRIDHVMGIQRIYCVPKGMQASEGVYVGYEMEEILALLTLESVQNRSVLVGEDLGTVSAELPQALEEHGIRRMHVLEYAMAGDRVNFESLTGNAVACINTHDLFPYAAWLNGEDLQQRWSSGGVGEHQYYQERDRRGRVLEELAGQFVVEGKLPNGSLSFPLNDESYQSMLSATLDTYAASSAPLVLVNLEDLWAERLPQNIPGTSTDAGNWQRRLRLSTSELSSSEVMTSLLNRLTRVRRSAQRGESLAGASNSG